MPVWGCLRRTARQGIHTTTVLPGRVDTPLLDNIQVPWISAKDTPQTVAHGIVRAILKQQPIVITPLTGRLLCLVDTISSGRRLDCARFTWRRQL